MLMLEMGPAPVQQTIPLLAYNACLQCLLTMLAYNACLQCLLTMANTLVAAWLFAGRVGVPEDVAELCLFLADPSKAAFITGAV
jgi:NAD(P)-dependent dehydrogenase (short-subunit alcohol dehydrogenase family)